MSTGRTIAGLAGLAAVTCLLSLGGTALAAPADAAIAEVAVLDRAVLRGDILSIDDFGNEERSAGRARGALSAADAAGKEAIRNLAPGRMVRASDVVAPRLVRRGEPVTITVRTGGLTINSAGRALSSGGAGDLVRVVSTATNRTLDGMVEGSGAVLVAAP